MTSDLPVAAGSLIAGKYRVERLLGDGGMGVVVAAVHEKLGERRAIKMMRPALALNPESTRRFLREAQAAARLRSEHVARVYDVDEIDGVPIMIMEYLEGADLAAVLADSGPLPVPEATLYVRQACAGLAEAHAAGLVHRDLKPSNLFLTRRPDGAPSVKVLDFGIAKAMVADPVNKASAVTAQGMMLGTAHYMSPEQMDAAPDLDGRTDLWSLGVTLYELLSGQVPFDADGMLKLFALITEGEPRPLAELAPAVPAELWAVVRRCLAKDRADRFPTALALAEALSPFAAAEGPRSVPARDLAGLQARRAATTEAAPAVSTRERTALDMEMDTAARPPEGERAEPALAAATPPSAPALAPPAPRAPPRWLLAAGAALAVGVGAAAATIALRPGAAPAPPITAAPAHAAAPASTPAEPVPAPPPSPAGDAPARAEPAQAPPASSASASASPPAPRPRSPAPPPRPTASAASPPRPAAPSRTEVNIP